MSASKIKVSDYVTLHNHTHYSLLDGLQKVGPMVERVKELGMVAIAITDHGTMSGVIELYKEAKSKGVKPIIGIETYIAPRKHTDKDSSKDKNNYHLTVLVKNNQGYKNLMRLSTIANLEGFYYKPRIDRDLLKYHSEGLIVLSGCIGSELGDALRQDQIDKAKKIASWYKKVFGENYYIELQDHGHPDHPSGWDEQKIVNKKLIKIAKELKIGCVVTMDAHYRLLEDKEAHEILICVQTGSFLDDDNRMTLKNFDLSIADPKDIIKRWGEYLPEAILNTKKISDSCNVELEFDKILIPEFPLPRGVSEKEQLEEDVYNGLAKRFIDKSEQVISKLSRSQIIKQLNTEVIERADYELQIIDQMGFNGYFLIIADFMNWGKHQGIVFGPGRGSAAGSIIAYALKITELDPLKYDLLFERFLNPDRISMPDIDIDIQDTRRDEVIQYCIVKYGEDRVANIVTFGRMAARNAIRDVSRVLRVPYGEADRLAKMVPPPIQGRYIPLERSIIDNIELKKEYKINETAKTVFDLAIKLEGTIRSHGVHAAGVVIAPSDIVNFVPLEKAQKGVIATQYSMGPVEDLGLLKIDFLGLSNLTTINNALRIIKKVHNIVIDIDNLPLDDKKTFELFQRGDTTGIFQFESSGMKRYLKELKPTVFEDIIAMGALYRPGPLTAGLTNKFIARKNGSEKVLYDHKLMELALKDTYGVMVYQEQFMQIVRDMCGFSGGESDTLRKAVGKKKRDMMLKMKDKVIEGAIIKGVSKEIVEKFWKDLEGFADYAFNKSHAACYGLIAYQTAYLKAHYPSAFMASLMTSDYDDTDRLSIEMNECQHMGIDVLPPDINESFVEFAIVPGKNQIRFGMAAVKNVGKGAVEEVLRARESGNFSSLEDFFTRINSRTVNKKAVESLIKTGAFDGFETRSKLMNNIEELLSFSQKKQKEKDSGQTELFGNNLNDKSTISEIVIGPEDHLYSEKDYLSWERELLGLYLSEHPLTVYEKLLNEKSHKIADIKPVHDGNKVTIGGIVMSSRVIQTKNGRNMAFVILADKHNEIEIVLFPKVYDETSWLWEVDKVLIVEGRIDARDRDGKLSDEIKINASNAREISYEEASGFIPNKNKKTKHLKEQKVKVNKIVDKQIAHKKIYVRMIDTKDTERLKALKTHINEFPGSSEVVLIIGESDNKQAVRIPDKSTDNNESINRLIELFGAENVKIAK